MTVGTHGGINVVIFAGCYLDGWLGRGPALRKVNDARQHRNYDDTREPPVPTHRCILDRAIMTGKRSGGRQRFPLLGKLSVSHNFLLDTEG